MTNPCQMSLNRINQMSNHLVHPMTIQMKVNQGQLGNLITQLMQLQCEVQLGLRYGMILFIVFEVMSFLNFILSFFPFLFGTYIRDWTTFRRSLQDYVKEAQNHREAKWSPQLVKYLLVLSVRKKLTMHSCRIWA